MDLGRQTYQADMACDSDKGKVHVGVDTVVGMAFTTAESMAAEISERVTARNSVLPCRELYSMCNQKHRKAGYGQTDVAASTPRFSCFTWHRDNRSAVAGISLSGHSLPLCSFLPRKRSR